MPRGAACQQCSREAQPTGSISLVYLSCLTQVRPPQDGAGRGGAAKSTGGPRCPRGQEGQACGRRQRGILCPGRPASGWAVTAGREGWTSWSPGAVGWRPGAVCSPWGSGSLEGLGGAPCGLGAASRRLLPGAARSASMSCAAPVPLRGADRCASERPGAGWTPVSRVPGGPWPRSLSADYELRFLKSKCKLR